MSKHTSPILDKALVILRIISEAPAGLSLAELVHMTGEPRSSVYRILNSFSSIGAVSKEEGTSLYKLGPFVSQLAGRMQPIEARVRLIEVAKPFLEAATQKLEQACKLSVREFDSVTTIFATASPAEYGLVIRTGHKAPLYATGAGKVLLAYLPEAEIAGLLTEPLKAFTNLTIVHLDALVEHLADVRRLGFAEDRGEHRQGIRSIAAPVFNEEKRAVAAVSIPFIGEQPPERFRIIRQAATDAAESISRIYARQT